MSTDPSHGPPAGGDDLAARVGDATRRLELEDPDQGLPLAERVINRAVEILGVGLLAGILGIIFTNAVTRYALNYSLIWGEEVVIGLVPWLAMTGLFLSVRRRQMIRIDFFLERFPVTREARTGDPCRPARRADARLARLARVRLRQHVRRRPDTLSQVAQGAVHLGFVAWFGRGRHRLHRRRMARAAQAMTKERAR